MKWKRRLREIEQLRRKHKGVKYKVELPDLKVEHNVAQLSNSFVPVLGKKSLPKGAKCYSVGHSHKQGLEMLTPDMLKNDLQFMSGKKT
jgi:hypothetical protein